LENEKPKKKTPKPVNQWKRKPSGTTKKEKKTKIRKTLS
jgi:hypothetical protein